MSFHLSWAGQWGQQGRSQSPRRPRRLILALGLALCVSRAPAEEIRATFKEVDLARETFIVTLSGQERTFSFSSRTKVLGLNHTPLKDGLSSKLFQQPGVFVRVKTETRDGKEVVVEIEVLRRGATSVRSDPG